MSGDFGSSLRRDLRDVALRHRALGHEEFRIAACRMLIDRGMDNAARAVATMLWDEHMTADELADRKAALD